jgi:hypothetical protein
MRTANFWIPAFAGMTVSRGLVGRRVRLSRAIWKPAKDWLVGIISRRLMFRCGGRCAIQWIVSAMSSAVIGFAPL